MLVIRFNRVGRKNFAQYRIVVQEKSVAPKGKHVAWVGSYNPHTKETVLRKDEIREWLAKGAKASDSVHNLLVKNKVINEAKRVVRIPAKEVEEVKDEVKEEAKAEAKE